MKFLVLRKPRVGSGTVPTSKLIREHKQRVSDGIKRGTIDCIYSVPGG